jgi:hypothetical protein
MDFNTKNAVFYPGEGKEFTPEEEAKLRAENAWAEEEPELGPELLGEAAKE